MTWHYRNVIYRKSTWSLHMQLLLFLLSPSNTMRTQLFIKPPLQELSRLNRFSKKRNRFEIGSSVWGLWCNRETHRHQLMILKWLKWLSSNIAKNHPDRTSFQTKKPYRIRFIHLGATAPQTDTERDKGGKNYNTPLFQSGINKKCWQSARYTSNISISVIPFEN